MPDAWGRPTPEEQFLAFLHALNVGGSIVKGVDTFVRAVERGRDPQRTLKALLKQLDEAAERGKAIESLRTTPAYPIPRVLLPAIPSNHARRNW